jgi:opacity protein-like surface antigen
MTLPAGNGGHLVLRVGGLCLLLALLSLYGVQAQDVRGGLRLGPAFGFLNDSATPFVSQAGKTEASTNVRIDVHAGGHLVVPLTPRWSLQPELQYARKGAHLSRTGLSLYTAERYQLSYLQGHLLGRRDIALPGPFSLHAVAGLTGAVATGATVRRTLQTSTRTVEERVDLLDNDLIRRWDAGVLVGMGLGYPVGHGTVALELRYNPGVRAVFTANERPAAERSSLGFEPPPLTATPPSLRHDVILVAVSYTVPFGP